MKKSFVYFLLTLFLCFATSVVNAIGKPYCSTEKVEQQRIIAYLGADSSWSLKDTDLGKLEEQLTKVTLVNYSFARFVKNEQGNTILQLSPKDIENIQLLRQLKPGLPIVLAVGGWGERDGFKSFLENEEQMMVFVDSVKKILAQHQLDGIDLDWENELLASEEEIAGVAKLLQHLHKNLTGDGYCVSNAVPATKAYWRHYPDAKLWQRYVNWTTIMAYDHYGTFGPRTELAAALYKTNRKEDNIYPYPETSANKAINHYYRQGLPAQKIILGIPFYCHSYYIQNSSIADNTEEPGLHVAVLDPNISSQVSYSDAYKLYGNELFAHQSASRQKTSRAVTYYGIIPIENTTLSRFLSCDGPQTVLDKIDYVKGNNPLTQRSQKIIKLGGVSFWSIQQDLPFADENSLLRAIYYGFASVQ